MKRFLALFLSIAMLLSFTACGSSKEPAPTEAVTPPTTSTQPTVAPTEAPTEPPVVRSAMGETVLIDNEKITFTVVGVKDSEHAGLQLQVRCVNKTDRALLFSWDKVSVCGYMYDPFWVAEVSAGKTANSTIELDTFRLEQMGVDFVDEISFTLKIVDSENFMETPIVQQAFTIYPTGLNAETVQLPQRKPTEGQVVVADNENVRFVIEKADAVNASEYVLSVYAENKTDRDLIFSWDMVSVNGYMIDPFWAASVTAGKKICSEITFYRSDLDSNAIEDVKNIEFTLLVSNYDDWEADYLLKNTYTYNP